MAETTSVSLQNLFRYDMSSRSAICLVPKNGIRCRTRIANNHHGNKMRHLKTAHRDIYDRLKSSKRKRKIHNACKHIKVALSINLLHAAFVELVTKNGRPFCICNDSGMRILIDPIIEGIYNATGEKHFINSPIIKEKVNQTYKHVRSRIIAAVKNRPLGLMADISTKHNYSLLGVSIRYCTDDAEIIVRLIGMFVLNKSHTAANLYDAITEVLGEYEIMPSQIISYTTDNAGNIVNVVDFMNNDCETHMIEEGFDLDDKVFEMLSDNFFGSLLENVTPILAQEYPFIDSVPCGAHTTQLSVNDSLKMPSFIDEIQFVKEMVKLLRTPKWANILRSKNLKQAVIDHEIRWNYTYLMVIVSYLHCYFFYSSVNNLFYSVVTSNLYFNAIISIQV